jgi:hypothetical protein
MEMLVVFFGACTGAIVTGWVCVWRAAIARKRAREQRQAAHLIAAVHKMAQLNREANSRRLSTQPQPAASVRQLLVAD